jgi:hypothetical protein
MHQHRKTATFPASLPLQRLVGMHHWARLGVIADNLVNMDRIMEKQAALLILSRHNIIEFVARRSPAAGFALPGAIDHNAAKSIWRREVAT